jgi:hypothetical protein
MDLFADKALGTECGDGHFLCDECLNPYLTQNIFPNLYVLKRNSGSVNCPAISKFYFLYEIGPIFFY